MKKIMIFGAGGFGREVIWLIDNINKIMPTWQVEGFLDDKHNEMQGMDIGGYNVLGGYEVLENYKEVYVVCAVGRSQIRKTIYERIEKIPNVKLATLIDPSVRVDEKVNIGKGSIICYNCVLTIDINIGKGVLMNTGSSVGHDAVIGDYCIFNTNSMAAGSTKLGKCCELGSGAFILQGRKVAANTVIAPLSSVLRDIKEAGIYSGNPARRMR